MSEKAGLPSTHPVTMPVRQASGGSPQSPEAVPTTDPMNTSELLAERLQAWKHAVGYLEEYVGATEKIERTRVKEYEKVLKTIENPLREGHHFDQSLGGMAGLLENMRQNTQGLVNTHIETEKNIKGSVLPILERLHKEIKNKSKELATGAVKSAKEVEKARNTTQKHVELLGTQTANFESSGGRIAPSEDPYVVHRGVFHRLSKQVMEENNNRHDIISVQNNFASFEAHIIEVIQQALQAFNQFVGGQAEMEKTLYADILGTAQRIPPDFEWKRFVDRNPNLLIDPNAPDRSVDSIRFPNENHASTKPLIEGTLERKSRNKLAFGSYSTGYYVVTPSKFLHEFKDTDNLRKDPVPELSIYLPDAVIGAVNGEKFHVKGKDVSKGLGGKLSGHAELAFKAHTFVDAQKWHEVIRNAAGAAGPSEALTSEPSTPVSPIEKKTSGGGLPTYSEDGREHPAAAGAQQPGRLQTEGITGAGNVASPTSAGGAGHVATPVSAGAGAGHVATPVSAGAGGAHAATPVSAGAGAGAGTHLTTAEPAAQGTTAPAKEG